MLDIPNIKDGYDRYMRRWGIYHGYVCIKYGDKCGDYVYIKYGDKCGDYVCFQRKNCYLNTK